MQPSNTDKQQVETAIEQGQEALTGLDQLATMAASVDAAISGQPDHNAPAAAVVEEPAPDVGPEVGAALQLLVTMAAPALPFMPKCYTPDVCQQIGAAFAAVAEKHGWDVRGAMGPEVALAFVSIPPTVAAVIMGREHFAQKRAASQQAGRIEQGQDVPAVEEAQPHHLGERIQPGA